MSLWPLRYRHGSETVEAFRWTGDDTQREEPQWASDALELGTMRIDRSGRRRARLEVMTPSGWAIAKPGNWIVRWPSLLMEVCSNALFYKRCAAIPRLIRTPGKPKRDRAAPLSVRQLKRRPRSLLH